MTIIATSPIVQMLLRPPMVYLLIAAGCMFILGAIFKSPWFKGWIGELQVHLAAKLFLGGGEYHVIRDVTIPAEGGTTQIDHIIVSRFGVFVVETKNMNGWIFGTERDAQWTQSFGRRSFKFQNPLRQNYKHTRTLAEMLGLPHAAVVSVIVFVGNAQLKKEVPENVTITGGYIRYIKSHREPVLSDQQVQEVVAAIAADRLKSGMATRQAHVQNVRAIVERKEAIARVTSSRPPQPMPPPVVDAEVRAAPKVAVAAVADVASQTVPPKCPRCGSVMILRTARRGRDPGNSFWGCSTFPKCRAIVSAEPKGTGHEV